MSALADLEQFEKEADQKAAALHLWQQPLRSILTAWYLSADRAFSGGRLYPVSSPNEEQGTALLSRLSYLTRFFGSCSSEIGADVEDAMSIFGDTGLQHELGMALTYAHFCEVMPQVHRGFLDVENTTTGFRLSHPNDDFRYFEERDILLTELCLTSETRPPPDRRVAFEKMVRATPKVPAADTLQVLDELFHHYSTNLVETPLLPANVYESSLGFSRPELVRFRAAAMAVAEYCLGMASAAAKQWHASSKKNRLKWNREYMEWASPLLNADFVYSLIGACCLLSREKIKLLASHFTIDLDKQNFSLAGDGFFPPFIKVHDALLFSPHAVKDMMPERNVLYSLNKTNKVVFDEALSSALEPQLLEDIASILQCIPGVSIKRNVRWDIWEIDLLAFQPSASVALQIQAKAVLPPQGARLTRQVEQSTLKAVQQLAKFNSIPATQQREVLSNAFGEVSANPAWISAAVSRSGFGTMKAWNALKGHAAFNPPLLRAAVADLCRRPSPSLAELPPAVDVILNDFVSKSVLGWKMHTITVFNKQVELPLLQLDYRHIAHFRRQIQSLPASPTAS